MKCASGRSMASETTPHRIAMRPAQRSMVLGCLADARLSTAPISRGSKLGGHAPVRSGKENFHSAIHCPPTNILAVEAALPLYPFHRRIGAAARFGDVPAGRRDVQHPPAHGDNVIAALFGSGMEDRDAGQGGGVQPGDDM